MIDYIKGDFVKRKDVDSFVKDHQIYQVEKLMYLKGELRPHLIECKDHNGVPCFFEPSGLEKVKVEVTDTDALGKQLGEKLRKLCGSNPDNTKPTTKGVFGLDTLSRATPETFEKMQTYKDQVEIQRLKEQVEFFKKADEKYRSDFAEKTKGVKYDPDKLQYSLIPPYALEEVARNLTIGLKKYPHRDNWKLVQDAEQRYLDALLRHVEAHRKGEVFDPDNPSVYHLAAVAVNALFLLEFMTNPDLDSKVFNKEEV